MNKYDQDPWSRAERHPIILAIMLTLFAIFLVTHVAYKISFNIVESTQTQSFSFNQAIEAIAYVESKHHWNASGDGGKAIGYLQIHKIYVDDVNRILGINRYTYEDRWDPEKSREMTRIYLRHYATIKRLGHEPTYIDYAAIHNAGPRGFRWVESNPGIKKYIRDVGRILNRN